MNPCYMNKDPLKAIFYNGQAFLDKKFSPKVFLRSITFLTLP